MERAEISLHQLRVFRFVADANTWLTNREIAHGLNMRERTVRAHTKRFVELGIFDQAEVFPAHKFRLSGQARKRNIGFMNRLNSAAEVFGL